MRTLITLGALLTTFAIAVGQVEPRDENPAIRVNTLLGPTGLITVPTSTTTRVERFQLGTAFGKDIRTVSVNWGIFDSIEIGGTVVDRNNQNNKVIATAKVTIIPQNFEWLELGFGAIDPFDAINNTVYGMASVNVRVPTQTTESGRRFALAPRLRHRHLPRQGDRRRRGVSGQSVLGRRGIQRRGHERRAALCA
jgi:hypothetical protein